MTPIGVRRHDPVAVQREDRVVEMVSEIDEFRSSLVAAVQAELERHASAVVAEVDRLREEGKRERASLRAELSEQLKVLAQAIEQSQTRADGHLEKARTAFEQRMTESEARRRRHVGARRSRAGRRPAVDAGDA
jgi:phosphoglycerate-specific signal transduction histidine kinase